MAWVEPHTRFAATVTEPDRLLLADPQTSGGLLIAGEIPGAPVIGQLVPRGEYVLEIR
jgi:selenide,water dikinase